VAWTRDFRFFAARCAGSRLGVGGGAETVPPTGTVALGADGEEPPAWGGAKIPVTRVEPAALAAVTTTERLAPLSAGATV
jgi:hypothetical protein